jgi:hypothetical protein
VLGMSRLRTLIPVSLLFALFSLCAPSALIYAVIAVFGLESPLTHRFLPFIAHYLVFIFLVISLMFLAAAIKRHGRGAVAVGRSAADRLSSCDFRRGKRVGQGRR